MSLWTNPFEVRPRSGNDSKTITVTVQSIEFVMTPDTFNLNLPGNNDFDGQCGDQNSEFNVFTRRSGGVSR